MRTETAPPLKHVGPEGSLRANLFFRLRLLGDLQVISVYRDVRDFSTNARGRIVDFGCGLMPYRHLFRRSEIQYIGLDSVQAEEFEYSHPEVTYYDGNALPLETNSVDNLFSSETFEHLTDPFEKAREILRILKPGGKFLVTVPWSARFHYQPHDYYRFTPSTLKKMFAEASEFDIKSRGTDITVICAKTLLVITRWLRPTAFKDLPAFLVGIIALPLAPILIGVGHLTLWFGWGSSDDPLGYTVRGIK